MATRRQPRTTEEQLRQARVLRQLLEYADMVNDREQAEYYAAQLEALDIPPELLDRREAAE